MVTAFSDLLTVNVSATLPGDHVLFPTSCVSFRKSIVSKGNQLDKGPRHLRKTMEHSDKPTAKLSKQRKWEHCLENLAQDEETHSGFLGIKSLSPKHPRRDSYDTSWAFHLCQNSV